LVCHNNEVWRTAVFPCETERHASVTDWKIRQFYMAEPMGDQRLYEPHCTAAPIDVQAKHRLQQIEQSTAGPGLWRAGHGIQHGRTPSTAWEAKHKFWQKAG